jgi:hypothetical protein
VLIVVDVESDGPCPGLYSMVCFGAAVVEQNGGNWRTFYGQTAPLCGAAFDRAALAISGFTREEHEQFPTPQKTMQEFFAWLNGLGADRLTFISDNNGYDWQFINYYCHKFLDKNPFGFSSRRIGDLWAGLCRNATKSNDWKRFRKQSHDHNPVNDAIGNAEAILEMTRRGLKFQEVL